MLAMSRPLLSCSSRRPLASRVRARTSALPARRAPPPRAVDEAREEGVDGGATKLFVGNLPWATDAGELTELFADYGSVVSADVVYDRDGRSRGFAFVVVGSREEAQACVEQLNDYDLGGRKMVVDFSASPGEMRSPRPRRQKRDDDAPPGCKLFVANLSYAVDDEWLQEIFEQAGEVASATVVRDESGRSRGFGFVVMDSTEAAGEAEAKIHGEDVDGRDLRVELAGKSTRRGPRRGGRDRDGGGGGDGGGWGDDAVEDNDW